jgi:single-stranded DNA-binding protein
LSAKVALIPISGWHRVDVVHPLGESIAEALHRGDHVLVDRQLISSKQECENGNSNEAKAAKLTIFWSVRANCVRRLSRAKAEAPARAAAPEQTSDEPPI